MRAHTAAHLPTWRLAARVVRYRLGLYTTTVVLLAATNALLLGIGLLLRWVFDALSGAAPAGLASTRSSASWWRRRWRGWRPCGAGWSGPPAGSR